MSGWTLTADRLPSPGLMCEVLTPDGYVQKGFIRSVGCQWSDEDGGCEVWRVLAWRPVPGRSIRVRIPIVVAEDGLSYSVPVPSNPTHVVEADVPLGEGR